MTTKQLSVIKDLSENVGKPVGQAMLDAGYSESTSKTPARLTRSKAWTEIMDKYLPNERLLEIHREGLEATITSHSGFNKVQIPDHIVRYKYLEMAYKIKGMFEKPGISINESKVLVLPGTLIEKYGIPTIESELGIKLSALGDQINR